MIPRSTLIAVLVGVEMALVFGMVVSVGGGPSARLGRPGSPAGAAVLKSPSSFLAGDHPALAIDVGMADVVIDAVPGTRIDVAVSDADRHIGSSAPITVRDDGGTVRIMAAETDAWSFLGDSRTVHISVPPATAVVVANAGNVTATGLRADATINSGAHFHRDDGITVRDFRGSLTAASSSGNLEVIDADCLELHVTSDNGRLTLTRVRARKIDASSSNGRVNGTGLQLHDGRVASSNGRVSLGFAPGADTTVSAASSNGRVNVSGLSVGGTQNVNGDDDDSTTAKMVRVGAGGGRLDVRSSNGSIDLTQEG